MGSGRWTDEDWKSFSTSHVTTKSSVHEIYRSKSIHPDLDPKNFLLRESCDSPDNPNSTPLIVALDVTGSMGMLLESMARDGLHTLAEEVYNRKPITDPHLMFMAVGDVMCDDYPLQVTQFEADIRVAEQLTKIYLEQGGGGNNYESYTFPWYFAAMHTKIDSMIKRGKKGYLFTVGDEEPNPYILREHITKYMRSCSEQDKYTAEQLLTMVSRQYKVFHLMVEEGQNYTPEVPKKWRQLLGQHAIPLSDHKKMGEVIISTIQVAEGANIHEVVNSWNGDASLAVNRAVQGLVPKEEAKDGLIRF